MNTMNKIFPTLPLARKQLGFKNIRDLINKAHLIAQEFRQKETQLIDILQQLDQTKAYRATGYNSLFQFCVESLQLTEHQSYNYITVARKCVEIPELMLALEDRRITVSKARKMASVVTAENQACWIQLAENSSQKDLELAVRKKQPLPPVRDHLQIISESQIKLQATLEKSVANKLRRVMELLAQKNHSAVSVNESINTMADEFLKKHDPYEKAKRATVRAARRSRSDCKSKANKTIQRQASMIGESKESIGLRELKVAGDVKGIQNLELKEADNGKSIRSRMLKEAADARSSQYPMSSTSSGDVKITERRTLLVGMSTESVEHRASMIGESTENIEPQASFFGGSIENIQPQVSTAKVATPRELANSSSNNTSVANSSQDELQITAAAATQFMPIARPEEMRDDRITLSVETGTLQSKPPSANKRLRSPLPATVRHHVWFRDRGQCRFHVQGRRCENRRYLEIHHKKPVALGGSHSPDNLVLVCAEHHKAIHGSHNFT